MPTHQPALEPAQETKPVASAPIENATAIAVHSGHTVAIAWLQPHEESGYWILTAMIIVFGVLAFVANWPDIADGTRSIWWAIIIVAIFGTSAPMVPLILVRRIRAARRPVLQACQRARERTDPSQWQAGDAELVLADALCRANIGLTRTPSARGALRSIQARLATFGIRPPGVILEASIAPGVRAIQRKDGLLEPECFQTHSMRGIYLLAIIGLPAAIIATWINHRDSILIGFVALAFGFGLLTRLVRMIRSSIGLPIADPVAGIGYIELPNGERLGSWQAVTLVTSDWFNLLRVRLLSEGRTLTLTFRGTNDPGFITFWQRWNHPHPRPEFLEDRAPATL